MDNSEALQLLEELDTIRAKAGLPRMDEVSRRDFLKRAGAGAAAAGMTAAGVAPGAAQAGPSNYPNFDRHDTASVAQEIYYLWQTTKVPIGMLEDYKTQDLPGEFVAEYSLEKLREMQKDLAVLVGRIHPPWKDDFDL